MEYTKEQQSANRKLWVAALRSGKYKQGKSYLRTIDDKFCCLGVACDILNIPCIINRYHTYYEYDNYANVLPASAQKALGINGGGRYKASKVNSNEIYHELWELNDISDLSFEKIADYIEKYENDLVKFGYE